MYVSDQCVKIYQMDQVEILSSDFCLQVFYWTSKDEKNMPLLIKDVCPSWALPKHGLLSNISQVETSAQQETSEH